MTRAHRLKLIVRRVLAHQRREKLRLHTAAVLRRLDDRLLADIGVPRGRIADYARAAAHQAVPLPPLPSPDRKSVPARLRSRRERRAAIRELSRLDDRLLRDIGIEPGRIGDMVDAALSQRRDLATAGPATPLPVSPPPVPYGTCAAIAADWTPDVQALRAQAANESPSSEPRRASAGG